MSAILSIDDLNDFISPGVACIKPIEYIPEATPTDPENPYEVTTEEKAAISNPTPTKISLTDCLACSGCVTSAEAVLVSLQSHSEVLDTLDRYPSVLPSDLNKPSGYLTPEGEISDNPEVDSGMVDYSSHGSGGAGTDGGKIFVASVSPQTTASLAAAYGVTRQQAGYMVEQLLSGENGLQAGGKQSSDFLWVLDTTRLRDMALALSADEVLTSSQPSSDTPAVWSPQLPVLASACPGWICYVEKTHPNIIPHLSTVKSPQSLTGTLIKSILWRGFQIHPSRVWHLAVMPCFDKKLEASRSELTSAAWLPDFSLDQSGQENRIRDVDCVITPRELIALAEARGIDFGSLPRHPVNPRTPFPDPRIHSFLFPAHPGLSNSSTREHGTSGGFLTHITKRVAATHPGSRIRVSQGRNSDVLDIIVESISPSSPTARPKVHFKAARYYGFRNIQNLVRKLKPAPTLASSHSGKPPSRLLAAAQASNHMAGARKVGSGAVIKRAGTGPQYGYVEVMACPGGCANGGGQLGIKDLEDLNLRRISAADKTAETVSSSDSEPPTQQLLPSKREWLAEVEDAYFSSSSSSPEESLHLETISEGNETTGLMIDGIQYSTIYSILEYWSEVMGIEPDKLVKTTYRDVSTSDILSSSKGKSKLDEDEIVAGLAGKIGSGW